MLQTPLYGNRYILQEDGTIISNTANKLLTTSIDSTGYPACNLWDGTKYHKHRVHSLMANHFLPNPNNKRTVNHIDGDKTNNNLSNLEWATDSENIQHAHDNIPRKSTRILSFEDIEFILFSDITAVELSNTFKVSPSHIRALRRGKFLTEYKKADRPLPTSLQQDYICQ